MCFCVKRRENQLCSLLRQKTLNGCRYCSCSRLCASSQNYFFLSSFQKWREEVLLKQAPPVVFADLGAGVLDSAMVEVAAYCLQKVETP